MTVAGHVDDNNGGCEYYAMSNPGDYSNHVYFGWAPTSTSGNNYWEPYELKIMQNGIDIVDNVQIHYLLQPQGVAGSNDNVQAGNWHFAQYRPTQPEWYGSYWTSNARPIVYRQAQQALDGSQLTMRQSCRGGHWPNTGNIVTASSPNGPWVIRGQWSGQSGTASGVFVDTPLSASSPPPP